jgi:hypothetical protein
VLATGESAVLWAANGSDAINVKYMMVDGQSMGWMGLGLNVHGSMKGAAGYLGLFLSCRVTFDSSQSRYFSASVLHLPNNHQHTLHSAAAEGKALVAVERC